MYSNFGSDVVCMASSCVTAADLSHERSCRAGRCLRCQFVRHQGWVDDARITCKLVSSCEDGKWHLRCQQCFEVMPKPIGTKRCHVLRHQSTKLHRRRVANSGSNPKLINAPSVEAFNKVLTHFRQGHATSQKVEGVGGNSKIMKMRDCLAEALFAKDRKALRQAARISLVRDMRKSRLLIRFVSVDSKLRIRRGTLGMRRNFGHSALAILKATGDILRMAATVGARVQQPVLDRHLLRHIRRTISMICTDSAADEITASEMMRGNVLENMAVLTPNLRVVLRDFAHSSRRTVDD